MMASGTSGVPHEDHYDDDSLLDNDLIDPDDGLLPRLWVRTSFS